MVTSHKILILVPGMLAKGGVSNYFQSLRPHFPENIIYLERGSRNWPIRKNNFIEIFRVFNDLCKFISILRKEKIHLIQTNTSFSSNAVFRDGLYLLVSNLMNRKTIVFFHGWDYNFVNGLNWFLIKLFKLVFFKSDAIIDLTNLNKSKLIEWGYNKTIYVETTAVADLFLNAVSENGIKTKYEAQIDKINLLFLARLEREKGLYEAINIFKILNKSTQKFALTIAGDGTELNNAKNYVTSNKIIGIEFIGFVTGEKKLNTYINAHIYVFPSYSEGMPTTVLEAMSCGLPILTTKVGGLVDFFQNSKNGYFIDLNHLPSISEIIIELCKDAKQLVEIGKFNFIYANNHFTAQKVAARIISIFEKILEK